MNVLLVEPGKKPREAEIGSELEALQAVVGGNIEAVYPWNEPAALVCNEEGKLTGLPLNRVLRDENGRIADIVAGTFFICGLGDEDFQSLPPELMKKFDARRYLEIAQARRATHTMLVPVQYQRLMAVPDFEAFDLSAFRMKFWNIGAEGQIIDRKSVV